MVMALFKFTTLFQLPYLVYNTKYLNIKNDINPYILYRITIRMNEMKKGCPKIICLDVYYHDIVTAG